MTASDGEPLVEATHLTKRFGARTALDRVSFRVAAGEFVGLVGANGSGKSTLLKLVAGLLRPSEGELRVFGQAPFEARAAIARDARFAFAPPALLDSLTAREQLRALQAISDDASGGRRAPARERAQEVEAALAAVGVADRADERVRGFSFGMRQRLALAQALLPTPRLLVLDEPSEGLDPSGVRELRELLARLCADHGVAIVLASHLSSEVETLVDRLLVLESGRLVFEGSVAALCAGQERLVIGVDAPERARAALAARGLAARADTTERGAARRLSLPLPAPSLAELQALLAAAGITLESYQVAVPSLEEVLLARAVPSAGRP